MDLLACLVEAKYLISVIVQVKEFVIFSKNRGSKLKILKFTPYLLWSERSEISECRSEELQSSS